MSRGQNKIFAHAFITGASSGLGEALARQLVRHQAVKRLSVCGRKSERLKALQGWCEERGVETAVFVFDLRERGVQEQCLKKADAACPLDLYIACAGITVAKDQGGLESPGELQRLLEVNCLAACSGLAAAAELMLTRRRGTLAAISSLASLLALQGSPAYGASKAALSTYCRALAPFLRTRGITLCLALPGFIETPMSARFAGPRPLMLTAEAAADRLIAAFRRGRRLCVFPRSLYWGIRLLNLLPEWLQRQILRFFEFEVMPEMLASPGVPPVAAGAPAAGAGTGAAAAAPAGSGGTVTAGSAGNPAAAGDAAGAAAANLRMKTGIAARADSATGTPAVAGAVADAAAAGAGAASSASGQGNYGMAAGPAGAASGCSGTATAGHAGAAATSAVSGGSQQP